MAVEPGGIAQDMHRFHVASGKNAIVTKRGSSAGNQSGLSTFIIPQPTSGEEASFQQERAMAQKMDGEQARHILRNGGFDLIGQPDDHSPTWIDGLPRDFTGWGPQTPDPQNPSPALDLQWTGEGGDHQHQVWRFEGRRHH